ncbi:hypothetical protein L4D09_27300 [Photobacterium makurazakiensis]|uniref:hypothetical protein n=1 Tax=Photobacterium makurazakiensis TaxID=2910234 RepID=UPI003D0DF2D3
MICLYKKRFLILLTCTTFAIASPTTKQHVEFEGIQENEQSSSSSPKVKPSFIYIQRQGKQESSLLLAKFDKKKPKKFVSYFETNKDISQLISLPYLATLSNLQDPSASSGDSVLFNRLYLNNVKGENESEYPINFDDLILSVKAGVTVMNSTSIKSINRPSRSSGTKPTQSTSPSSPLTNSTSSNSTNTLPPAQSTLPPLSEITNIQTINNDNTNLSPTSLSDDFPHPENVIFEVNEPKPLILWFIALIALFFRQYFTGQNR